MGQHNPLVSAMQTIYDLTHLKNESETEIWCDRKYSQDESYSWEVSELDMTLIRGYYVADGKKADQVLQTPFENYCVSKVGNDYELFEIGCMYRPMVVSFKDHLDIKNWLEQEKRQTV